jgi:hypothetical protein
VLLGNTLQRFSQQLLAASVRIWGDGVKLYKSLM